MNTDRSTSVAVTESGEEWIFYRLAAFGRTFHFNVTLNRWLVAPSFGVDVWNETEGRRTTTFSADDCYYVGYIAKQEVTSRVAISNCQGLV